MPDTIITGGDGGGGMGTGSRTPAVARPVADSETGRGLILVDHLAAAWTVRRRPVRGTSVIAGLALHRDR